MGPGSRFACPGRRELISNFQTTERITPRVPGAMQRERCFAEPGPVRTSQGGSRFCSTNARIQFSNRVVARMSEAISGNNRDAGPGFRVRSSGLRVFRFDFKQRYSQTQLRLLATCFARGLPEIPCPLEKRARGIPGARCTRSLACKIKVSIRASSPRSHRFHPAFPAQWVTAYNGLSPVTGLFCHRRLRFLSQT